VEYLEKNIGDLQISEHSDTININMENIETKDNKDKKNTIENAAWNLNEIDNDNLKVLRSFRVVSVS